MPSEEGMFHFIETGKTGLGIKQVYFKHSLVKFIYGSLLFITALKQY